MNENEPGILILYNKKFKPAYERGKYGIALDVILENPKMIKHLSQKEGEKMYDFFAKKMKPVAKKLRLQLERSLGVNN